MKDELKKVFKKIAKLKGSARDPLQDRVRLAALISAKAENGEVAIVYGGMDCDCARWDDRVAIVPANIPAVVRWVDEYMEGAEGPQWTDIEKPSVAAELKPGSRDLALEAFENGNPYSVAL